MIIWLASYPRSGNTYLRILLKAFFGIKSHSLYDDKLDIAADEVLANRVGHVSHFAEGAFAKKATTSRKLHFVKTHGLPTDEQPAIYLVRDGRAACSAFWDFRKSLRGIEEPLQDIVVGNNWVGAWGQHVEQWMDAPRERTLILKYEKLVSNPRAAVKRIAEFLGREPLAASAPTFAELHAEKPDFFRSGSNDARIELVDRTCPTLFDAINGAGMVKARYQPRIIRPAPQLLAKEIKLYAAEIRRLAEPPPAPRPKKDRPGQG